MDELVSARVRLAPLLLKLGASELVLAREAGDAKCTDWSLDEFASVALRACTGTSDCEADGSRNGVSSCAAAAGAGAIAATVCEAIDGDGANTGIVEKEAERAGAPEFDDAAKPLVDVLANVDTEGNGEGTAD